MAGDRVRGLWNVQCPYVDAVLIRGHTHDNDDGFALKRYGTVARATIYC